MCRWSGADGNDAEKLWCDVMIAQVADADTLKGREGLGM